MNLKGLKSSKGQVFVIIGIVIALSLLLIKIKTNFDVSLKKKSLYVEMNENEIFDNVEDELRESYDVAVKERATDYNLNRTLREYILFMKSRGRLSEYDSLTSFSTYDNESLNVTVQNFLGRKIEDVVISQNLTDGDLTNGDSTISELLNGETYTTSWSAPGETVKYGVNITYTDTESGQTVSKVYTGNTGPEGVYTSLFYRIEFDIMRTTLTDEDTAHSRPI